MYKTIIRQQHIIDRTEQERLLLFALRRSIIKRNTPLQSGTSRAQNDALETQSHSTRLHSPLSPHRKEKYGGRDIDAKCIKSVS